MRVLVDVNLSPRWVDVLRQRGIDSVHWSSVGELRARDQEIMEWARANGCIVFTHDLDFGAILALTRAVGPSVVQIRTQDVLPESAGTLIAEVLREKAEALEMGAIVTIDEAASRVRILPIRGGDRGTP